MCLFLSQWVYGAYEKKLWGARVAQSVKRLTLGFDSGHDLTVVGWSPLLGSALTVWNLLRILSLLLSPHPQCALSLSQKKKN